MVSSLKYTECFSRGLIYIAEQRAACIGQAAWVTPTRRALSFFWAEKELPESKTMQKKKITYNSQKSPRALKFEHQQKQ